MAQESLRAENAAAPKIIGKIADAEFQRFNPSLPAGHVFSYAPAAVVLVKRFSRVRQGLAVGFAVFKVCDERDAALRAAPAVRYQLGRKQGMGPGAYAASDSEYRQGLGLAAAARFEASPVIGVPRQEPVFAARRFEHGAVSEKNVYEIFVEIPELSARRFDFFKGVGIEQCYHGFDV